MYGTVVSNYHRRGVNNERLSNMGKGYRSFRKYAEKTSLAYLEFNEQNIKLFTLCVKEAREQARREKILADNEARIRLFLNNFRRYFGHRIKIQYDYMEPTNWLDAGVVNPGGALSTDVHYEHEFYNANNLLLKQFCEAAMSNLDSGDNNEHEIDMGIVDLKSLMNEQKASLARMSNLNSTGSKLVEGFLRDIESANETLTV